MDLYRSKEWKAFRSKIMALDNGQCVSCGRTATDGVTLHVHHKRYVPGNKPWEYPHEACETLCGGCHAAKHGVIPPKHGWEFAGWDDLGDLVGTCDLCGHELRYTFLVTHPDWIPLEVGESCCDHLTSTAEASNKMESVRRYAGRRNRFIASTRWHKYPSGNERIKHQNIEILIVCKPDGFAVSIERTQGKIKHLTAEQAKGAAFDFVESGEARRFLSKQQTKLAR